MKTLIAALLIAAAAAQGAETNPPAFLFAQGAKWIDQTSTGYTLTKPDGTRVYVDKTSSGYCVSEKGQVTWFDRDKTGYTQRDPGGESTRWRDTREGAVGAAWVRTNTVGVTVQKPGSTQFYRRSRSGWSR